ncbi:MAG: HAD family hydrolase [Lachnospiraceae bacterium]|uniref:HAD family hydrolase n=1 Tax=Candidatus Weimeria bifida TaxID=2599074 RepID=A0A6N7J1A2_9FIRM|nr:HAD family hydrolase [Candidatus Weimeria bifida]RRF97314.1 MAG: HAD family hydrolase [Lachnospiraceae bacterium]
MKHYKNYIFDLYGTLVDIETNEKSPSLWKKMAELYSVYGADYRPAELRRAYTSIVKEEESILGKEEDTAYPEIKLEKVFVRLYKEADHTHESIYSLNDDQLPAFSQFIANAFRVISRKRLAAYPNTEKVLKTLKERGCGVYLLSNAQYVFTMPEIEKTGLLSYFDGMFISSEHRVRKPEPEFMRELLDEYGLDKDQCVMVGNDYDSDIGIAASVGMDSIFINTFELSKDEKNKRLLAMRSRVGCTDYEPVLTVDDIGGIV